jgi:ribosome biogenesis GTPase
MRPADQEKFPVTDLNSPSTNGVHPHLTHLGWDADFARGFAPFHAEGRVPARVVAEHRGRYVVSDGASDRPATLAGRLRHQARCREDLPATGDWVALGVSGEGVDALGRWLRPGRTAVLLGSSGVGKSTLVNRLMGGEVLRTGAVRDDGKGRHTTTHRQMVRLAGGALLIDTPGMRELQLWTADAGLDAAFADVEALAARCRFGDCAHGAEPGCAVRAAARSGALDPERLESWHRLRRELAWLATRQDEAAASHERARLRTIHRAQRAHYRHSDKR